MKIDNYKKECCTIGMNISYQPSIIDIAHDAFHASKSHVGMRCVEHLAQKFPNQIIGVKDSSYNLYENLKLDNFSILPGSESKLLKGLKLGCHGIITATCNVTASLSRKVYEDFINGSEQNSNEKLCEVRKIFEEFNLISAIHTFMAQVDNSYNNILPPLSILNDNDRKKLFEKLQKINFNISDSLAA